jgi:polyphosphate kinase 2
MAKDGAKADDKMKRKLYDQELHKLQIELCRLQEWVKATGTKIIVVFEGRDAAGKGGTIKALVERVSPRLFRVVALPAPSDREKGQLYMQRYISQFPAAGEVVILDRSWYNRAGVEYVMNFATEQQHKRFLQLCLEVEKYIVDEVTLIKIWLERRFRARIEDPLRQWKLSPIDLESCQHWYRYSKARDLTLEATDTKHAPWHIVRTDDKRRGRLNCIAHILSRIPYQEVPRRKVKLPKRSNKGEYDDQASLRKRRFARENY